MEPSTPVLLVGIGLRKAPNRPAVRVGRIAGLVAGPDGGGSLPPSALRLPEPLAFAGLPELRAWLVAREARLAAALHAIGGGREVGIELHEDAAGHAAWLREGDEGLAGGASAGPARAARRHLIGQRVETILAGAARAAVLPAPGAAPASWTAAVPAAAVQRLRAALDLEARRLAGTGLSLRFGPPGGSGGLARAILQDA